MLNDSLNSLLSAALVACLVSACGGDTSAPTDVMGDDDGPAATEDDDTAPAGDDDATPEPVPNAPDPATPEDPPFEMTDPTTLPDGAIECTYTRIPNEKITDFSVWSSGEWGDAMSLTGGSFFYHDPNGEDLSVEVDTDAGTAHITGTITGYAGWGLWFGPCTNASRWTGIRFVIGGSMGTEEEGFAQLEVQVQTNNDYPIDAANMKGACGGDWGSGCGNNSTTYETFPETPMEIRTDFTEFTGGAPVAMVEPAQLLGLQWQFNCATGEACQIDVILEEVSFY